MQLSDCGPEEGLRVTSAVGQLNKEFLLGFVNLVYNGVAKRSILDKPVIAFRMFKSVEKRSTFPDGRSDLLVNPRCVAFNRNSFARYTVMRGAHKDLRLSSPVNGLPGFFRTQLRH